MRHFVPEVLPASKAPALGRLCGEGKWWFWGKGWFRIAFSEEMVVVAKGKLLKSRLPRRSEKRKALDVKSAGTQHRHPRGKSPHI
jgi:hypothetical protein